MPSAIPGFTPTTVASTTKSKGFNDMNGNDFIKLMITQLQQQDPLDPAKSDQLLTQMSQIKQLESSDALSRNLNTMSLQQSIGSAGNLINKTVNGINEEGDEIEGIVTSVKVQDKKVYLELDNGQTLPMENLTQIAPETQAASALSSALSNIPGLSNLAGMNNNDLLAALQGLAGAA